MPFFRQLCLQLTVNTILPVPTGLIDGEVIYISTKQNFLPQRLDQLLDKCIRIWKSSAQHKEVSSSKIVFTKEEALKKIYPFRVLSLPELIASIYKAQQLIESNFNKNVRLIIVDSFATFLIDLEPLERVRIIYELLHILQETATRFGCAVVLTNDMTTHITTDNNKESLFQSQALKPALGETFLHRIQQRIVLTKSQKDPQVVIASVQKNVNGGPSLVRFRITRDGIEDVS